MLWISVRKWVMSEGCGSRYGNGLCVKVVDLCTVWVMSEGCGSQFGIGYECRLWIPVGCVPDADKSPRKSTQEQANPFLTKASEGHLNDSRDDINTETEDGVPMATIGLSQTPLAGGTSRHRSGCNSTSHHYSTLHGS
ncbi:hypothetical protein AVEN_210508-1 [Araneus ventricosus]|uniref:Uncharacterized protein n=1 Tax=Araneus ventricosus TaxID=182803 RepID=A0A4Y2FB79_ARAVE|nr:hypothetical protein AVEN_210508-1 [Araneus ventricosus]